MLARLTDPFGDMPHGGSLLTREEVDRINELIKTAKVSVSFDD